MIISMLILWILGLIVLLASSDVDSFSTVGKTTPFRRRAIQRSSFHGRPTTTTATSTPTKTTTTCFYERANDDNDSATEGEKKKDEDAAAQDVQFTAETADEDDTNSTLINKKSDRPRFELQYTCGACKHRNSHMVSYDAYNKGVVIATCKGCGKSHMIADNLGWMKYDRGGFGKSENNIEDMYRNRSDKKVKRMNREEWKRLQELEELQGQGEQELIGSSSSPSSAGKGFGSSSDTSATKATARTTTTSSSGVTPTPKKEGDGSTDDEEPTLLAGRGRISKDDDPPLIPF